MRFTVETNLSEALAGALARRTSKAERLVAEQVRKDTSPYVPFRTGSLDQRTRVEGNMVIYPGPYARFLYYGKLMVDPITGSPFAPAGSTKVVTDRDLVFTKDFHPLAQAHWFEASKAQNLEEWLELAQKAVDKYGE